MKRRVGVLMGGPSCERDISLISGRTVCRALKNKGIDVVPVELEKAVTMNGYREAVTERIRSSNIDVAFIALHGGFGEDGGIQGILEDINIPYTGSRIDASRLGMDKIGSKDIFRSNNIPIPRYTVIKNKSFDKKGNARVYFKELGSPLVVKPSNEGSSIGLAIVNREPDFYMAISQAFKHSDDVIIEEYVRGREITVGILEDKALPIVEIIPKKDFFDFEAKYQKGLTEYKVPAQIDKEVYKACQETALMAHKAVGASFFSRIDMILAKNNTPVVLEVNTIPGLTETSLLPKAAMVAGVDFDELILKILESSL
jgi:D-alanine-D-alanine ligase